MNVSRTNFHSFRCHCLESHDRRQCRHAAPSDVTRLKCCCFHGISSIWIVWLVPNSTSGVASGWDCCSIILWSLFLRIELIMSCGFVFRNGCSILSAVTMSSMSKRAWSLISYVLHCSSENKKPEWHNLFILYPAVIARNGTPIDVRSTHWYR
jgi:hypothetical protein